MYTMSKISKVLLVSAVVCLMPVSVFAELIHQDSFDSYDKGAVTETGFSWSSAAYVSNVYESEYVAGGNNSNKVLAFRFQGSSDIEEDATAEARFELGDLYTELWLAYSLYVPDNYFHRNAPGSDNKKGWVMLWSGTYGQTNNLTAISWWPTSNGSSYMASQWKGDGESYSRHYDEDDFGASRALAIDTNSDLGKWQDVVIHVKVADYLGSDGKVQIWKNGKLIHSVVSAANYGVDESMNGIEKGYLLGWSNAGFDEDTTLLVDDFKVGQTAESIGFNINKPVMTNPVFNIMN